MQLGREREREYQRKRRGKKLHDRKKREKEKGDKVTTRVRKQGGFCFIFSSS